MSRRRYAIRDHLQTLDPERDHWEIYRTTATVEFPWDLTRALELALYRTYAVPAIGALLDETGEFRLSAQKRYDDTALLLAEILDNGYDSERGRAALARMNRIHARYEISQDDYRYVLGTFVFVPVRWLERYGWRPLTGTERLASFHYYRAVGARMGIRDIPTDYAAFEAQFDAYEKEHFTFGEPQRRTAIATRELLVSWLPAPARPLAPLVRLGVHALLDEPLRGAFGFPEPPRWLPPVVDGALRARARVERLLPPRAQPSSVTRSWFVKSYPDGYRIDELGPESTKRAPGTTPGTASGAVSTTVSNGAGAP